MRIKWKQMMAAAALAGGIIFSISGMGTANLAVYAENGDGKDVISLEEALTEAALKEGNHAKYIDRLDLPGYALDFYKTMEDNLSDDGFLTAPKQDQFLCSAADKVFYGVKIAETEYFKAGSEEVDKEISAAIGGCFGKIYDAFIYDHPEVFWLSNQVNLYYPHVYKAEGEEKFESISCYLLLDGFIAEKYTDEAVLRAEIAERDRLLDEIVSGAADCSSEAEKVTYLNDWLTYHNSYNSVVVEQESAEEVSLDTCQCICALRGTAGRNGPVCTGYAKAFQLLCSRMGIESTISLGMFSDGSNGFYTGHAWNLVKVDGVWYGTDVTWNDPYPDEEDSEQHEFLLVGSETEYGGEAFAETHTTGYVLSNEPEISATEYDASLLRGKNIFYTGTTIQNGDGTSPSSSLLPEASPSNGQMGTAGGGNTSGSTGASAGTASSAEYRAGEIFEYMGMRYQILSEAAGTEPGTVSLLGFSARSTKKVICKAAIVVASNEGQRVYKLVAIGKNAFQKDTGIQQLILGENIKTIGRRAFYGCKGIKSIQIKSQGITRVGSGAFAKLRKKVSVLLPKKRKKTYKRLLKKAGMKKVKYR